MENINHKIEDMLKSADVASKDSGKSTDFAKEKPGSTADIKGVRTQKARGIKFLEFKKYLIKSLFGYNVPTHLLFNSGSKFFDDSFNFPVFVRPCPTVPRHGFVDSVRCNSVAELNSVSERTKIVEPFSELLVTKPIKATNSAIFSSNIITFSGGNDGATSGKDVKYFHVSEDPIYPLLEVPDNIIADGEVPFYEFVFSKDETNLVQIRSAPAIPKVKNYVPHTVKVEKIIKAEGDLLDWEFLLKNLDKNTTIIDHTNGSLASHYAIHALTNNIPIFTTYVPELGSIVEPTVENTEVTDEDIAKFKIAFRKGFATKPIEHEQTKTDYGSNALTNKFMGRVVDLGLATLHNYSAIAMAKDYEIIGIVLGMFVRAAFTVSAGEARFANSAGISKYPKLMATKNKHLNKGTREGVYEHLYELESFEFLDVTKDVAMIFKLLSWGSAYGGKKWFSCTNSTTKLYNACIDGDVKSVVELFNKVIHEQHNGGFYLNKVANTSNFDSAAQNPSLFAMKILKSIVDNLQSAWQTKEGDELPRIDLSEHEDIIVNNFIIVNPDLKIIIPPSYKPTGIFNVSNVKIAEVEFNKKYIQVKKVKVTFQKDSNPKETIVLNYKKNLELSSLNLDENSENFNDNVSSVIKALLDINLMKQPSQFGLKVKGSDFVKVIGAKKITSLIKQYFDDQAKASEVNSDDIAIDIVSIEI